MTAEHISQARAASRPVSRATISAPRVRCPCEQQARIPARRLLLTECEAAESLGMSVDMFREHVKPHLALVRLGRGRRLKTYVSPEDLERWVQQQMALGR